MGGFPEKVDFKRMDLMGLVHLNGITVQYPFKVFRVVHMMMHVNIAVPNRIRLFRLRMSGTGDLRGLLSRWKTIEEMFDMLEHRLDLLRFAAL